MTGMAMAAAATPFSWARIVPDGRSPLDPDEPDPILAVLA